MQRKDSVQRQLAILVAEDEEAARFGLVKALRKCASEVLEASDGEEALRLIRGRGPDLVFLDLNMPKLGGLDVLRSLESGEEGPEIVVVTADDEIRSAVECIRLGAADYVTKPYELEQIRAIARRTTRRLTLEARVEVLEERLEKETACGALVGASSGMQRLFSQMKKAAKAPLDLLLRGETGTGKELIARELHRLSPRSEGPFVAVNAAAIAESLAESTLFGHRKGAFTGADSDHDGLFLQADGGTLFLDEVGDMPLALQTKVLRALQEREVTPVGGSRARSVDVRVISATHQDLEKAIEEGQFRQDLYYRVKGIFLHVPPLRERREDILLLADHFLERFTEHSGERVPAISGAARQALLNHPWPGNVRELENVVLGAAAMCEGDSVTELELGLPAPDPQTGGEFLQGLRGLPLSEAKTQLLVWFERRAIGEALETTAGNISAAARRLGIHRQSLQQKMDQLGLERAKRNDKS